MTLDGFLFSRHSQVRQFSVHATGCGEHLGVDAASTRESTAFFRTDSCLRSGSGSQRGTGGIQHVLGTHFQRRRPSDLVPRHARRRSGKSAIRTARFPADLSLRIQRSGEMYVFCCAQDVCCTVVHVVRLRNLFALDYALFHLIII